MNTQLAILAPALCSAGGIIVATAVATFTADSGLALQALGPLLLAASMLGSDVLKARLEGLRRAPSRLAWFMTLCVLVALVLTGVNEPAMLPMMLPILGGGAASTLITPIATPGSTCGSATASRSDK